MKLRNKKTGEIVDSDDYMLSIGGNGIALRTIDDSRKDYIYDSLAEFVEEWEDYTPKEPLIKDKKIRKAVRAWFEINKFNDDNDIWFYKYNKGCYFQCYRGHDEPETISFRTHIEIDDNRLNHFGITELCGEEEDDE